MSSAWEGAPEALANGHVVRDSSSGFSTIVLMSAARLANAVIFERHAHPGATGGNHHLWRH